MLLLKDNMYSNLYKCYVWDNQFVHNEGMLAIIFEFEANRYAQMGDLVTAGRFKAAVNRAIEITEYLRPVQIFSQKTLNQKKK